jgi:hypothetical protein
VQRHRPHSTHHDKERGTERKTVIRLKSTMTEWGWPVESRSDLLFALLSNPAFAGIGEEFIAETLEQMEAEDTPTEFETVGDLSEYILQHYF